jgi:hypothetical protein
MHLGSTAEIGQITQCLVPHVAGLRLPLSRCAMCRSCAPRCVQCPIGAALVEIKSIATAMMKPPNTIATD